MVSNTGDNVWYVNGYYDNKADGLPVMTIVPADLSIAAGVVANKDIEVHAKQRANSKDVRPYQIKMPISRIPRRNLSRR